MHRTYAAAHTSCFWNCKIWEQKAKSLVRLNRQQYIQDQEQPIEVKIHGRRARRLFRKGLNLIRKSIFGRWILRKFRRLLGSVM